MKLSEALIVAACTLFGIFLVALGFIWLATVPNDSTTLAGFAACFALFIGLHSRYTQLV